MKTIAQILDGKSLEIISVRPGDSVLVALEVMSTYNIGALPVVEAGQLVGIFPSAITPARWPSKASRRR